jgi:nitric oxide reductase activation protein
MFEQDLLSNEEGDEANQTTFHQINDELLNTFIKEKEQERQQLNSKKLSSTLESNGAMYYCLTVEDAVGGAVGLDTARYGAMTSTLQMSSTLD